MKKVLVLAMLVLMLFAAYSVAKVISIEKAADNNSCLKADCVLMQAEANEPEEPNEPNEPNEPAEPQW